MEYVFRIGRALALFGLAVAGAFFALWAVVIWRNLFRADADNIAAAYVFLGCVPAAMAGLCVLLGLMVTTRNRGRTAVAIAATCAFILIALAAGLFF